MFLAYRFALPFLWKKEISLQQTVDDITEFRNLDVVPEIGNETPSPLIETWLGIIRTPNCLNYEGPHLGKFP